MEELHRFVLTTRKIYSSDRGLLVQVRKALPPILNPMWQVCRRG
jgi:hypothetical protein